MKFRDQHGSAVVEFLIFIVFGQLLVFAGAMQASEWMDRKLRLELFANQVARAESLGKSEPLLVALKEDYGLDGVVVTVDNCAKPLSCITAKLDELRAFGVSYEAGK